jgi:HEAT repeat protein
MDDLNQQTAHLRGMATLKATPERRKEIIAALDSKWDGVQAVAVQVLGAWGGEHSKDAIKRFLVDAFQREAGWGIRGVAIKAVGPLLDRADVDWVLDLYFGLPSIVTKHEVFRLVLKLPAEAARKRLVAALRDVDWMNRQAAVKAIGNMAYPDRPQLLRPLRDDPHESVRESARLLSESPA